jgi:hypothetical protein
MVFLQLQDEAFVSNARHRLAGLTKVQQAVMGTASAESLQL